MGTNRTPLDHTGLKQTHYIKEFCNGVHGKQLKVHKSINNKFQFWFTFLHPQRKNRNATVRNIYYITLRNSINRNFPLIPLMKGGVPRCVSLGAIGRAPCQSVGVCARVITYFCFTARRSRIKIKH